MPVSLIVRGIIAKLLPLLSYALLCQAVVIDWVDGAAQGLLGVFHAAFLFAPALLAHKELRGHFRTILAGTVMVSAICFYTLGWPLVAWICLLAGIGLGQTLASQGMFQRSACTLQVFLCLILLFFFLVPRTLELREVIALPGLRNVLVIAFILWAVAHIASLFEGSRPQAELITSALFFLLCCLMVLSVSIAVLSNPTFGYFPAVLATVIVGIIFAGCTWVLWSPNIGGGLSTVFFRHMLSMNVPFDIWMREMTDLADASRDVEEFWRAAMEALVHRTNIVGVSWQVNDETIMVG